MIYRFGDFTLDPASFRLLDKGTLVPLSPKIIDLLLYLVARPSVLVSKEELFKALWPDVAVTDNALTQAVSELRQALGDDASSPAYVQTVSRRGYRFIAAVHHGDGEPGRSAACAAADGSQGVAARLAGHRRAGLRQRERRSRDGMAVVRDRGDGHERSSVALNPSRDRSRPRR